MKDISQQCWLQPW